MWWKICKLPLFNITILYLFSRWLIWGVLCLLSFWSWFNLSFHMILVPCLWLSSCMSMHTSFSVSAIYLFDLESSLLLGGPCNASLLPPLKVLANFTVVSVLLFVNAVVLSLFVWMLLHLPCLIVIVRIILLFVILMQSLLLQWLVLVRRYRFLNLTHYKWFLENDLMLKIYETV
jgi:hypothetical protein